MITHTSYLKLALLKSEIFKQPHTYLYSQAITPISFKKRQIDYPLLDPKIFFKSLINK